MHKHACIVAHKGIAVTCDPIAAVKAKSAVIVAHGQTSAAVTDKGILVTFCPIPTFHTNEIVALSPCIKTRKTANGHGIGL